MRNVFLAIVLGFSSLGFAQENVPVKVLQDGDFGSKVKKLFVDPSCQQHCVVSLANGLIQYYDGVSWQELHYAGGDSPIKAMSVDWSQHRPRVVIGLKSGKLLYYNGHAFLPLQGSPRGTSVTQMSVDWEEAGPRIVVGLECGAVMYYAGGVFSLLAPCSQFTPAVTELSVDWSAPRPRIVAALECGSVKYYDGHQFFVLQSCYWQSPPVRMSVDWSGSRPRIVIALKSSAVHYFDGQNFSTLAPGEGDEKPRQMSVDWSSRRPQIILGYNQGSVRYYDGAHWRGLHDSSWQLPVRQMSVDWTNPAVPRIVVGLGVSCKGCPEGDAQPGGAVVYFDGNYWRELHDNSWKSPITFMSVNWTAQRDPAIAIGQGVFYWMTEHARAREALSRVAVYASGQWAVQAVYSNPVCGMNVKWPRGSADPIILYCLGKNLADVVNGKPQGPDAYKIIITEN